MDATEQTALVIIAALLAVALLAWFLVQQRRSRALQSKFGDEYDRTVEDIGKRGEAEAALLEREKRVKSLDIRPLTFSQRAVFSDEWTEVKALFVDSPAEATLHADRLLANMMQARGYPMADFDRRYEDLTVDHAEVARHYREGNLLARRQTRGEATTEDLRQALKHYEALFEDLVRDARPDEELREPLASRSR
jgi:hypothetical protein